MQDRTLGPTGIEVSPLDLGSMMSGAWESPDHDAGERISSAAQRRRPQGVTGPRADW